MSLQFVLHSFRSLQVRFLLKLVHALLEWNPPLLLSMKLICSQRWEMLFSVKMNACNSIVSWWFDGGRVSQCWSELGRLLLGRGTEELHSIGGYKWQFSLGGSGGRGSYYVAWVASFFLISIVILCGNCCPTVHGSMNSHVYNKCIGCSSIG